MEKKYGVGLNIKEKKFTEFSNSKKKKVLLISPDSGKIAAETQFFSPPLGIMRLVGYLNLKGHSAEYYDPNLYACNKKGPSLEEKILESEWDIIGFSVLDETLVQDIENIYLAGNLSPNSLLIAGGSEAQYNYQTLLDKTPCRVIILGEGEIPLKLLADGKPLQDIPGIVFKNQASALSEELFNEATESIDWENINYEDYWDVYRKMYGDKWNDEIESKVNTVRVFSRNRCPIGCVYCSSTFQLTLATDGNVPVVSMTEDNLVSVVERIVKSHPSVKMIYLTDDDFVINKQSVIKFCKKVIEKDFGDLKFMCFARITDLNEKVISWMSKANFCKLNVGLESFSQNMLTEIGKRCDTSKIEPVMRLLKKYNISPFLNIILTSPKCKLEDVELTVTKMIEYLQDDFYMAGIISGLMPFKGTQLYETNCNFSTHIVNIESCGVTIKRDDYIYPDDKYVKEFQKRYLVREPEAIKQLVESSDIRHAEQVSLALMQMKLSLDIINEIKKEKSLGTFKTTENVSAGSGRLYKEGTTLTEKRKGYNEYSAERPSNIIKESTDAKLVY